jgi:hypothetical protein
VLNAVEAGWFSSVPVKGFEHHTIECIGVKGMAASGLGSKFKKITLVFSRTMVIVCGLLL